jgi:hypothetical protein
MIKPLLKVIRGKVTQGVTALPLQINIILRFTKGGEVI